MNHEAVFLWLNDQICDNDELYFWRAFYVCLVDRLVADEFLEDFVGV